MAKSDVRITKTVSVSAQNYYGPTRIVGIGEFAKIVDRAVKILRTKLNFPEDVQVRIANIKKGTTRGYYYSGSKTVVIDPRFSVKAFFETLCHELVHAEQYFEKRMEFVLNKKYQWQVVWQGKPSKNKGSTYARYRAQPWEIEAFERQEELAKFVMEQLYANK